MPSTLILSNTNNTLLWPILMTAHKLDKLYRKASDIQHLHKTKSQNETQLNNIYGNGYKHVTHFVKKN